MIGYNIRWYILTGLCLDIGYRLLKKYLWPVKILYLERFPGTLLKIVEGLAVAIFLSIVILDVFLITEGLYEGTLQLIHR